MLSTTSQQFANAFESKFRLDSMPEAFCWTKMGTEAGQSLDTILRRQELERRVGDGVFAWGIGSSLGGTAKLAMQESAEGKIDVFFTQMKSAAKQIDIEPSQVLLWLRYVDENDQLVDLPNHIIITSRGKTSQAGTKRSHYALICNGQDDITVSTNIEAIDANRTRNYVSLNPLGASQVTAVVRYQEKLQDLPEKLYPITFRAKLHGSGFVRLASPVILKDDLSKFYLNLCKVETAGEWSEGSLYIRKKAAEQEAKLAGQYRLFA
jgi:hypothetical protein